MKTLTINTEIAGMAKNALAFTRGLIIPGSKFRPSAVKPSTVMPAADDSSVPVKSFMSFAKGRFFTIFLQLIEVFYIVYR